MTMAVVAKEGPMGLEFLTGVAPLAGWSTAERLATRFADFRSATRIALMLAARHRAFALPESRVH